MKNFLIEFFRPLDNLIFNYFVKIGAIQPIFSAIIGAGKALLGSSIGKAAVGSAVSGAISKKFGPKVSGGVRGTSAANLEAAYSELRDPSDIIREAYETGIYSPEVMSTIIGAEERLLPEFQRLAETAARGVSEFQEASKLRQLGLLGQYGADVRSALEDPRLAQLAGMDVAEAERLTAEAAGPLGVEAARTAEQTALGLGQRMGRTLDASTLARAALGRESAQRARRQEAAGARQRALQSASAAQVDPSAFLLRPSSTEEQIFLQSRLGPQITDPGMAATLGSATDVQRANVLLGKGLIASQAEAARANIAGQRASTLGSILGGIDFKGFGSKGGFTGNPATSVFGLFGAPSQSQMQREIDIMRGGLGGLPF
jgi:hypothetical protein